MPKHPPSIDGVSVALLGPLEARLRGRAVPLPGARLRRLLAILAVDANQVVPADRIADSLWSGDPPATATTALHVLVSRLRQVLEPDRQARSAGGIVATVAPGYRLELDRRCVDSLRFEDDVSAARALLAAERWDQAVAAFDAALGTWRGPALEEFADEPFASTAVARWDELRAAAAEDRVDALLALGHHADLIAELETLVAAAPYRERRTGQLMKALYRTGRQADALRAYERLRRLLADELGIVPGPELRRLEHAVLLQDEAIGWDGAGAAPPAGLFGRDAESAALRDAFVHVQAGRARVVLVSGEPGIGKTSALRALATEARTAGADVWWGTCRESAGSGPYVPWIEALTAAGVTWPSPPAPDLTAGADAARRVLFDAVVAAIRAAAVPGPLVVVLDDLQWADVASLRLVEAVAAGIGTTPVLLAVAYREAAALGDGELAAAVARLATRPDVTQVAMSRLSADAVAAMVQSMTGARSPALVELVQARTAGNPLFVRELVRLLAAAGAVDDTVAQSSAAGVPQTVRAMVERTYARLSADAREVVAAAAVAGRNVDAALVAAIADVDLARCEAGARDALAAGLLVEDPGYAGQGLSYRFSHDLVRESVYHQLSAMRRARLHRSTGEALEHAAALGEPVTMADLAHHFVAAARSGGDATKAVRYAAQAGEEATAAFAYEEAVRQYERAVEAGAAIDAVDRTTLLLALGDARWRTGDVVAARETFLEAVHEARRVDRPDLLVRAVLGFGGGFFRPWHATRGAFGDRPAVLLEEALAAVGPEDGPERVRLLGQLAEELYYTDDPRRFSLSAEAVTVARRLGDAEALAAALCSRCLAVWSPDHVHERLGIASEIVGLADALGRPELRLFGLDCRFVAEMELGDTGAAAATLAVLEAAAGDLRQPLYLWEARRFRAMEALFRGRYADAERIAGEALEIGNRAEDPDALAVFAVQLGMVRFEQGRGVEVVEGLRALADEFAESPAWRAGLCVALADQDVHEAAAELEHLAPDRFSALPQDFALLAALAMLSDACWLIGDPGHAAVLYDRLLPYADRNIMTADRSCWGSAAHYLGLLASVLARWDDAVAWFERAVDTNQAMGSPPWTAHSRHGLALALARRGHAEDASRVDELMASASATAEELGMERLLRRIRHDRPSAALASG
jgi:DNA-binding SARP family transcriptional activator